MEVHLRSPCKVNLILNILGKRPDGFHELETIMHPVRVCDDLSFRRTASGITLTCSNPALPTDSGNLVYRAAEKFFHTARISQGAEIHLEKRIPLAAGLGGGSGNAAATLLGLNELFGFPLKQSELLPIASELGSDIPFFLQNKPALALGRGEQVVPVDSFPALRGTHIVLVHPGFGVSTAWAYKNLARFPAALNGERGRARRLADALNTRSLEEAGSDLYNSLEAPVLEKYPLLVMFQEFFRANGAAVTMMSGSGSTTFAIVRDGALASRLVDKFQSRFGEFCWITSVPFGE